MCTSEFCPLCFLSGRAGRCHFMPYDYSPPHVCLKERPRTRTADAKGSVPGKLTESSRSAAFSVCPTVFCVLLRTHLQAKFNGGEGLLCSNTPATQTLWQDSVFKRSQSEIWLFVCFAFCFGHQKKNDLPRTHRQGGEKGQRSCNSVPVMSDTGMRALYPLKQSQATLERLSSMS